MFLLIDKPKGITSHDVIDRIRNIVDERPSSSRLRRVKVGHAGTLDPNATGLLIVGVGRQSTKKLGDIATNTKKSYEAEVRLGEESSTDDVEGVILGNKEQILPPSKKEVEAIIKSMLGVQDQVPPMYSSIKINGKKAYELARKGEKVEMKPRKITIHSIKLLSYVYPRLDLDCTVSSGTYIRAIARDIGKKLGCGAYLGNLRRTAIGEYSINDSVRLEHLTKDNWKQLRVSI